MHKKKVWQGDGGGGVKNLPKKHDDILWTTPTERFHFSNNVNVYWCISNCDGPEFVCKAWT